MIRAALLVAAAALAAGCGAAQHRPASALTPAGRLFAETCGACHTLAAAGTHGTAAKSLDERRPSVAAVLQAIRTGPGAMPERLLTGREARAVARFVAQNAR